MKLLETEHRNLTIKLRLRKMKKRFIKLYADNVLLNQ